MLATLCLFVAFQAPAPQLAVDDQLLIGSNQLSTNPGALAFDGETLLTTGDDPSGEAVFVFTRSGGAWAEQATLNPSVAGSDDKFGGSVAVDGDLAAVGAIDANGSAIFDGVVFLYERSGGAWTEQAILSTSAPFGHFGYDVVIDGDTILVGDPVSGVGGVSGGSAHVFVRSGSSWAEQAALVPADLQSSDWFGHAVAIEGDLAAVGAYRAVHSGLTNPGAAYVFERSGGQWTERAKLISPFAQTNARFGFEVLFLDGRLAVAAERETILQPPLSPGAVHIFDLMGGEWTPTARLFASDGTGFGGFGGSLAYEGSTLLVGAQFEDVPPGSGGGAAYVYVEHEGAWIEQMKLTPTDTWSGTYFGRGVGLGADAIMVLATGQTIGSANGVTYVFDRTDPTSYCTAGTTAIGCQVSMSARGVPSASRPDGFSLEASGAQGLTVGLFFYGTAGRQAQPWGNGTSFQCIVPPVKRGALQSSEGSPTQCAAFFAEDLNARWCPTCPKPLHNPGPGNTVQAQFWFRDPNNTSNQTTSLSDAIEFPVGS